MSPRKLKTEWHGRQDFAEYAEAVGVRTDEIMAARPGDMMGGTPGPTLVIYTTGTDDLDTALVHSALLSRNADGVLTVEQKHYRGTLKAWMRRMGLND